MILKKSIQDLTDDLCKNTKNLSKKDARLVALFTVVGTIIATTSNVAGKNDIEKELTSCIDMCDKELK